MAIMTEDEIDDVLYLARTNDIEELKHYIPSLFPKYGTQPAWILSQAIDPDTGNSALHFASANGHLDMAKHLLTLLEAPSVDVKAHVNRQNQSGNTPLHWAALNGHIGLAKFLLTSGADASILNASGHDAVYEAEMNDKQEVAEYLLKEALGLEKALGGDGASTGQEDEGGDGDGVEGSADAVVPVADGMRKMSVDPDPDDDHRA